MTGPHEPDGREHGFEPMPTAPALDEEELGGVAVERPRTVTIAFVLWLVVAVVLVVGVILLAAVSTADIESAVRKAFEQQGRQASDQDIANAAKAIRIFGIALSLVLAAAIVGVGFVMRRGKNWARITLCALGAVVVIVGLLGFGGGLPLIILEFVVGVVAAVFMFRRESGRFFAAHRKGVRS
jgi:hypothetical protein